MRRDWLLWAALRLVLLAIVLGLIPWAEQVNDLAIYADWAAGSLSAGAFPDDPLWQYPPLAGPVLLLGWALPGQGFGYALLFLAVDAVIMAMLAGQSQRTGHGTGRRLWALAPLLTGPLLIARFDVVPTALAVAAVLAAARPGLSGALAALGAWVKVWPALVLAGLRRRDLPGGLAGAAATSLAVAGVLLLVTDDAFSFLTGQVERGLQVESVAAWPFLVARALGAPVDVAYQYGAHEVVAAGTSAMASAAVLTTLALLGLVAVQRLRGALEGLPAADVALAAVLFSVATSRVFSGQYYIWLLGLAAVCLGAGTTRLRLGIGLLIASAAAAHLVYPWLYSALLAGHPVALAVQTVRVGLVVAAVVISARVILRPPGPQPVPG